MKTIIKFNKTTNKENDLYKSSYNVNYQSDFNLGHFKIYNLGFGCKPWVIELNNCRFQFEKLMYKMGYSFPKTKHSSLKFCKHLISEIITDLSNLDWYDNSKLI